MKRSIIVLLAGSVVLGGCSGKAQNAAVPDKVAVVSGAAEAAASVKPSAKSGTHFNPWAKDQPAKAAN